MVTRVAFLGLGHMGLPMARNLVAAGYDVIGFDVVPAAVDAARAADIPIAASGIAAASDADVVLTMFPSGRHVIDAYENGLLAAARADTLFIDSSTIAVDEAQTAHELALAAGHRSIDAPVSGGVVGAENGTLAFMVGGSEEDFASALPLLEVMGRRIVHCGGPGLGQAAKVCNNMILGISMIGVGEAFVLAEKLGLSHQALFDVASTSSGQCWSLTTYCPVPGPVPTSPANRDYKPGFAAALMLKDLKLAQEAAQSAGAPTPLGAQAAQLYSLFEAAGHGGTDFSGIIRFLRGEA